MIDFETLLELAMELHDEYPVHATIAHLAMSDIPMSDAVIKLGVACNVLMEGYRNGWSEEVDTQ